MPFPFEGFHAVFTSLFVVQPILQNSIWLSGFDEEPALTIDVLSCQGCVSAILLVSRPKNQHKDVGEARRPILHLPWAKTKTSNMSLQKRPKAPEFKERQDITPTLGTQAEMHEAACFIARTSYEPTYGRTKCGKRSGARPSQSTISKGEPLDFDFFWLIF